MSPPITRGRIGVFGGTFDPIHAGHVDVARAAADALRLDRVLVIPARVSPHRHVEPFASPFHRFAMVALAAAADTRLVPSDIELESPGPSYTALTLDRLLSSGYERSQLFFITGADAFAEIDTWRDYPALLDRCSFVVVSRPGHPVDALAARLPELASRMRPATPDDTNASARLKPDATSGSGHASGAYREALAVWLVDAPTAAVSSTEVRRRVAAGEPLAGLVSSQVEQHIRAAALYTGREDPGLKSRATGVEDAADQTHG